jgi:hypothetical protein
VWTPSSLDSQDAVNRQCCAFRKDFGIDFGKNVVCHSGQAVAIAQSMTESFNKRRFTGADRSSNANDRYTFFSRLCWRPAVTMLTIQIMHVHVKIR